jgi:hypothetical protein
MVLRCCQGLIIKDILLLTTTEFRPVRKDRLYYDQFEYCLGFYLAEVNCLRELNHASIDDVIERRKQWREIARQRWNKHPQLRGIHRSTDEITADTVENLHSLAEMLLTAPEPFKLVTTVNHAHVYTNDIILINRLSRMPCLAHKTHTRALVVRPRNTVQLKNPVHAYRTYFKMTKLTAVQKTHLENFLLGQEGQVRLSSALKTWLWHPFNRVQDYFFVDHDSESWITMLNLVQPGIIRKTQPIVAAK